MRVNQHVYKTSQGWLSDFAPAEENDLIFIFCSSQMPKRQSIIDELKAQNPAAALFGCTTAGEIHDTNVVDDALVVTAIKFEKTRVALTGCEIKDMADSFACGQRLATSLEQTDLTHVVVLSDGLQVNGSELVNGLAQKLPANVNITGGLSGDGDRFENTEVILNNKLSANNVAALGFYGHNLKVGYASLGGWDSFGPYRRVTRAEGNVLFELDDENALELYKKYLGPHAENLPSSALLFPLSLRMTEADAPVVRTILQINEKDQSMVFAGDIPQDSHAQFMKANFERLIDGATDAAITSKDSLSENPAEFALLISCVGRKLVLKQRVEEEVEAVRDVLGPQATLAGFYSYGEISPFSPNARCELHNQTMTITTFAEV